MKTDNSRKTDESTFRNSPFERLDLKTIKSTQNFSHSDKALHSAYDKNNVLFPRGLDSEYRLVFTMDSLFCLQIIARKKYFFT